MIEIKEISFENVQDFWKEHIRYLIEDEIISKQEDIDYFSGSEYRGIIENHMNSSIDKLHMVWFVRDNIRIGAVQYKIYQSEDGECFILDYWVFPQFRGNNTGRNFFYALVDHTKADGAIYYKLNARKEDSIRFWKSLGFVENGKDEFDSPLFIKVYDNEK